MDYIDQMKYRPYLPYIKEGIYALAIDVLICIILATFAVVFGAVGVNSRFLLLVIPFYLAIECFVNYRIMLLSVIEVHLNLYEKKELQMISVKKAPELVGRWDTVLNKIYSDYKYIEKDILRFRCADGRTIKLRCVFYGTSSVNSKAKSISAFERNHSNTEEIVYGKLTKVIISRDNGRMSVKSGMWNRANL